MCGTTKSKHQHGTAKRMLQNCDSSLGTHPTLLLVLSWVHNQDDRTPKLQNTMKTIQLHDNVDDAARNVPILHLHHVYTAGIRCDQS